MSMKKFFSPNIDPRGRRIRGIMGGVLLLAGLTTIFLVWWVGLILLGSAAFVLFEAMRGWCGLRACGIKTKW